MLDVRLSEHSATGHEQLRAPVRGKVVFAMTSNLDALFVRHGFDGSRIFTPQGDFARMQCQTICADVCRDATWPSRPILERIAAATVPATGVVIDPEVSPACPHCGGEVFLNLCVRRLRLRTLCRAGGSAERVAAGGGGRAAARQHPEVPEEIGGRSLSVRAGAAETMAALVKDAQVIR